MSNLKILLDPIRPANHIHNALFRLKQKYPELPHMPLERFYPLFEEELRNDNIFD